MTSGASLLSAKAVADRLVSLADKGGDVITPMKLLKLVYIAHGWNLAINGRPLFGEPVEAWEYGPVIPDLYHSVKKFGMGPVVGPIGGVGDQRGSAGHDEDMALVGEVFDKYRSWDAFELSEMTHYKGTPWDTVWNHHGGKSSRSSVIPNDLIRNHFVDLGNKILSKEMA